MHRSILLSIFLLSLPSFCIGSPDYEKVLRLAEQAKPTVLYAREEQWSKFYLEKEKKACEYLTNYTQSTLEESLIAFAEATLCTSEKNFTLKKIHSNIRGTGLSGSSVYKILDCDGNCALIVKVIPFHEGSFLKEVAGLNLISSLALKRLKTAIILGMGYIEHLDQTKSYLIAESVAAGKNIDDYLIKIVMMSRVCVPRTAAIEEAREMFFHFGRALGELHGIKDRGYGPLHPLLQEHCSQSCQQGIQAIREKLQREDLACLLENKYSILQEYMLNPGLRYSFMHGDAQFANYFYDQDNALITIIDMPASAISIAQSLAPIGSGVYDYAKILEHLEMRTLFGLTEEEMHFLKLSFNQGYMASGMLPPTDYQLEFFTLVHDMRFITHYFEGIEERSWAFSLAIDRILNAKIKRLERELLTSPREL